MRSRVDGPNILVSYFQQQLESFLKLYREDQARERQECDPDKLKWENDQAALEPKYQEFANQLGT